MVNYASLGKLGSAIAAPILAVILVACSAGAGPADTAREWMDAFAAMDGNRSASLTCDAMQDSLMMGGGILSATQILSGQLLGFGADIDVSDLEYDVLSESGDEATVRVSGTMRAAVLGISRGEEFDSRVRLVREDGEWKVCG